MYLIIPKTGIILENLNSPNHCILQHKSYTFNTRYFIKYKNYFDASFNEG